MPLTRLASDADTFSGQKYSLKTNKKGEFFSLGVAPGKYKITLIQNGQVQHAFLGISGATILYVAPHSLCPPSQKKGISRGSGQPGSCQRSTAWASTSRS